MAQGPLEFDVAAAGGAGVRADDFVAARIRASFRVRERALPEERCTYFDTFDHRLGAAGGVLSLNGSETRRVLSWKRGDERAPLRAQVERAPSFKADLPAGALADELGPLIDVRRLLPLVEVRRAVRVFDVLDGRDKTVARAELRTRTARRPASPGAADEVWVEGAPVLRLQALRGYAEDFHRLQRFVQFELRLAPRETGDVEDALALAGATSTDGSSGPDGAEPSTIREVQLDPDAPSAEAARSLLRVLFRNLRANVAGTRADLDTEFLHELRVAARRTRALLTELKHVFPEPAVQHYGREFHWLGELTGPCRDHDVLALEWSGYVASLPEAARAPLEPIREHLSRARAAAHTRVAAQLGGERFRSLAENWGEFLTGAAGRVHRPEAEMPIGELVGKHVRKRFRRVRELGAELDANSPPERVHELRIAGKRLRYLLELFEGLFEPELLRLAVRRLKRFQTALGDFNDLVVHEALIEAAARACSGAAGPDALLAAGRLLEHLAGLAGARRELALLRVTELEARDVRKLFRRLGREAGRP